MYQAKHAFYLVLFALINCGGQNDLGNSSLSNSASEISSSSAENENSSAGNTSSTESASSESSSQPSQVCLDFGEAEMSGELTNSAITTISGITASHINPDMLYGITDAGGPATIYLFDTLGLQLGTIDLAGINQQDWEDIATGPAANGEQFIYVGDIGDNAARQGGTAREQILLYRFKEPKLASDQEFAIEQTDFERIILHYPSAAHDAETLMIHPLTGDILIFTKEDNGHTLLFTAPADTPPEVETDLQLVADINLNASGQSGQVSAGDIDAAGTRIFLRTYTSIFLWEFQTSLADTFANPPTQIPSADEPQSEGLTFSADGNAWYSMGERSTAIYSGTANCN